MCQTLYLDDEYIRNIGHLRERSNAVLVIDSRYGNRQRLSKNDCLCTIDVERTAAAAGWNLIRRDGDWRASTPKAGPKGRST